MTHRAASVVAVVAALAVGQVITGRLDVAESENPPFVRTTDVGKVAHLSYADVEVTDVRPAQYLAPEISTDLARLAGGVWVLVSVAATATREPTRFAQGWLVDREGRVFRSSASSGCAPNPKSHTGVTVYTLFCFDVPADVLPGLHFRLARGDIGTEKTDGDDLVDVDLGIDDDHARSWARTEAAIAVVSPSLEPFELREVTLNEVPS